jgi:hypothetical protein
MTCLFFTYHQKHLSYLDAEEAETVMCHNHNCKLKLILRLRLRTLKKIQTHSQKNLPLKHENPPPFRQVI